MCGCIAGLGVRDGSSPCSPAWSVHQPLFSLAHICLTGPGWRSGGVHLHTLLLPHPAMPRPITLPVMLIASNLVSGQRETHSHTHPDKIAGAAKNSALVGRGGIARWARRMEGGGGRLHKSPYDARHLNNSALSAG